MRSTYFNISQGVFCVRSKDGPSFISGDDTSDESESENEHGFFTYPCDEKVFLIYESKLLELLKYCMHCGNMLTSYRELKNTGSQLTLLLKCKKGILDFIKCFTFFDVFKGTYATCKKYAKYMKICFKMKYLFQCSLKFPAHISRFWLY